jgi:mono/diheme cytochrome c family protein
MSGVSRDRVIAAAMVRETQSPAPRRPGAMKAYEPSIARKVEDVRVFRVRNSNKESGMRPSRNRQPLFCMALVALSVASAAAAPTSSIEGIFNSQQAQAGKTGYNDACASCHGATLQGGAGPALSGASFKTKWRDHPLRDLFDVVHDQMPLNAPGTLSEDASLRILAYILSVNGFHAGAAPMTAAELDLAIAPPQTGGNVAEQAAAPIPPRVPVTQPTSHVVSQQELDAADTDPKN